MLSSLLALSVLSLLLVVYLVWSYRSLKSQQSETLRALELSLNTSLESKLRFELGESRRDQAQQLKLTVDTLFQQLSKLTETNEKKLSDMTLMLENKLKNLQQDNSEKLEKMRATVEEKLQGTLEKRLGESFKLVSERLELVHKGLGEMQTLASGVGDLKKVLSNVKNRGMWGEIQLEALLEQVMTPDQFSKNVATKPNSNNFVEFAIRLPGREDDGVVWLPIDSKFPMEDYARLVEAQENGNLIAATEAAKLLTDRIKSCAKDIQDKYLSPPYTTDFGIMFLPTESLYAEVLRQPGLFEMLQQKYRVTVAGPTTLLAVLNSLQLGFRSLVIEKRSSEVWKTLGIVKSEFSKFSDILDKLKDKLRQASDTVEIASSKSRNIETKLRKVESLEDQTDREPPSLLE